MPAPLKWGSIIDRMQVDALRWIKQSPSPKSPVASRFNAPQY
jgi:hypothetical protein